jgi:hypothetical protein
MLLDVEHVEPLPGPYEILELAEGEVRVITPEKWQVGKATIQPRDGRPAKAIVILRVHVPLAEKPTIPQYWDITSQHLLAGMVGYLEGAAGKRYRFHVTKRGEGPRARFELLAEPVRT